MEPQRNMVATQTKARLRQRGKTKLQFRGVAVRENNSKALDMCV